MLSPESDVPYVLALTLIEGTGPITTDTRIRICVRSPAANRTHPDTVSVPTQRIPAVIAEEMLRAASAKHQTENTLLLASRSMSNELEDGHKSLIYAVEALFAAKLGVGS